MKFGSRRTFLAAAVVAVVALGGAALTASLRAEASAAASQAGQAAAQGTGDRVPLSEEVFKQVVLLRGIPVDTFFDAMGMFANAMGNDCTYCHVSKAYFDKAAFAEQTPRMQRARQMITMMNAINKQYFGGQPRVTCFTCHAGSNAPRSDPSFLVQYGTPVEDPSIRDFATDTRLTADQVFDKYLQAIGGADRVAKLTSYTAKGTYAGFDTSFDKVPVELYAKAPGQQTLIVRLGIGISTRTYDGRNAWMAGPETPLPLVTLTEGNLDRVRIEGMIAFPSSALKKAYPQWRLGRTAIDDQEVVIVQGIQDGQPIAQFYFDQAGLLIRFTRWTRTPVGFVPVQIDYADYRDVAGVKIPFKRITTQTHMQMTVELTNVQPNVAIDAARFARPAPAKPAA